MLHIATLMDHFSCVVFISRLIFIRTTYSTVNQIFKDEMKRSNRVLSSCFVTMAIVKNAVQMKLY